MNGLATQMQTTVLAALWGLCAAGITAYCLRIAGQISYVTLSDGRRQERRLPFVIRLLLPFVVGRRPLPPGAALHRMEARTARQLIAAGLESLIRPAEFTGLRFLMPVVFGGLWVAFIVLVTAASPQPFLLQMRLPLCVLGAFYAVAYPTLWLRAAVRARHQAIRRSLPFVLDVLTLSVEAGLDFMTALQRHVERAHVDALGEELLRVIREIQLGKTRREALRDMAVRVDFSDLKSVTNALVQADELGVSIGAILRIQSGQIRQRRFERAERLANEAPIKMLFPLLLFIFPSVFLILLGPVLLQIIRRGF